MSDRFSQKLSPDGVAFLHHSNLGDYDSYFRIAAALPRGQRFCSRLGLIDYHNFRARSVSASKFARVVENADMVCFRQELVNWSSKRLIDCFSTIGYRRSRRSSEMEVTRNPDFMAEAERIRVALSGLRTP